MMNAVSPEVPMPSSPVSAARPPVAVWPWPIALGLLTTFGLLSALLGQHGIWLLLSWAALAANLYRTLRKRRGKTEFPKVDTETLRELAPMFTLTWLFRTLEDMARQMEGPALFNGDGEDLVFHEVCLPLAKGVTQKKVVDALEGVVALRPESRSFWNWLKESESDPVSLSGRDENGRFLRTEMDDGAIVLGTVELKGRQLRLQVNSGERAERGRAMLQAVLGTLVGAPLTQIMTPVQAMDDCRGRQ